MNEIGYIERKTGLGGLPSPALARLVREAPKLPRPPASLQVIDRRTDARSCGMLLLPHPIWGEPSPERRAMLSLHAFGRSQD